jgi:hypothetical protein
VYGLVEKLKVEWGVIANAPLNYNFFCFSNTYDKGVRIGGEIED